MNKNNLTLINSLSALALLSLIIAPSSFARTPFEDDNDDTEAESSDETLLEEELGDDQASVGAEADASTGPDEINGIVARLSVNAGSLLVEDNKSAALKDIFNTSKASGINVMATGSVTYCVDGVVGNGASVGGGIYGVIKGGQKFDLSLEKKRLDDLTSASRADTISDKDALALFDKEVDDIKTGDNMTGTLETENGIFAGFGATAVGQIMGVLTSADIAGLTNTGDFFKEFFVMLQVQPGAYIFEDKVAFQANFGGFFPLSLRDRKLETYLSTKKDDTFDLKKAVVLEGGLVGGNFIINASALAS